MSRNWPSDIAAVWVTPMSKPTALSVAERSNFAAGLVKLTNQRPERSLVTRADDAVSMSIHVRVILNLVHPHLGTKTCPHLRFSRLTDKSLM